MEHPRQQQISDGTANVCLRWVKVLGFGCVSAYCRRTGPQASVGFSGQAPQGPSFRTYGHKATWTDSPQGPAKVLGVCAVCARLCVCLCTCAGWRGSHTDPIDMGQGSGNVASHGRAVPVGRVLMCSGGLSPAYSLPALHKTPTGLRCTAACQRVSSSGRCWDPSGQS